MVFNGRHWSVQLLAAVAIFCPADAWAYDARALSASCAGKDGLGVQVGIYLDEVLFIRPTQFRAIVTRVGRWTDFDSAFTANGTKMALPVDAARRLFWDPDLRFSNLDGSRDYEALETRFEVRPTGQVTITERAIATFRHSLDLALFPYDEQELKIRVSPGVCTDEITITTLNEESGVNASDYSFLGLWHKNGHSISARTVTHSMAETTLSEATLMVKVRRSPRGVVYAYFLPSQLLVVGSWLSFWLPPDQFMPRVVMTWLAMLIWMNCQSRLVIYGLPQVMHNSLTAMFTWSMGVLLVLAILQNIVTFYVGRTTSVVLAEKFDLACRVMYPAFLALFWLMLLIALADLDGLRKKTRGELSSTFDAMEGIFLAIVLLSFAITTGVAVRKIFSYHKMVMEFFVDASAHMMTDAAEIANFFRHIAGRKEGWVAGRRRAYITVKEIDEALDKDGVPDDVRRGVKDTFKKEAMDPAWISQQDFCSIWRKISQTRYEEFHDPEKMKQDAAATAAAAAAAAAASAERVKPLATPPSPRAAPPSPRAASTLERPPSPGNSPGKTQERPPSPSDRYGAISQVTQERPRSPPPEHTQPSEHSFTPSNAESGRYRPHSEGAVTPALHGRPPLQPTPRGQRGPISPSGTIVSAAAQSTSPTGPHVASD